MWHCLECLLVQQVATIELTIWTDSSAEVREIESENQKGLEKSEFEHIMAFRSLGLFTSLSMDACPQHEKASFDCCESINVSKLLAVIFCIVTVCDMVRCSMKLKLLHPESKIVESNFNLYSALFLVLGARMLLSISSLVHWHWTTGTWKHFSAVMSTISRRRCKSF